jgi:transaldolase/glucose-6-phosphate isomerase
VTFVASPGISALGGWLEQLIAESTGKAGLGLIPIDGEAPTDSAHYGTDRVFVYLRLETAPDAAQDEAIERLALEGQPVVRIGVHEPYGIGQEFFRWEIATAVAGARIGINPFDQPDVEASKTATRALTDEYERTGSLPGELPFLAAEGLTLYADPRNARALMASAGPSATLEGVLRAHLARLGGGDYFALLAYLEMSAANEGRLQRIRHAVRDARGAATCVGFGPRFLHSTGQAYKGGPNTGVFLQITCDDATDLPVPGRRFTFGVVKAAQARGDFQVLAERKRRALRVHLGSEVSAGLARLEATVVRALAS